MSRVLERFSIQNFQNRENYVNDKLPTNVHWETRARKLKNRKWRELNRKIMNESHSLYR
jgi:hypothetical protein